MEANNLSRNSTQPVLLKTAEAAIASCEKLESDFRNTGDYCHNNIGAKTCEDWERMDKFLLGAADEMRKIRKYVEFLATVLPRQNPRNCDVGTAEEQYKRRKQFCFDNMGDGINEPRCSKCPLGNSKSSCIFDWGQMPY